jgi:hypothetical protein
VSWNVLAERDELGKLHRKEASIWNPGKPEAETQNLRQTASGFSEFRLTIAICGFSPGLS